MALVPHAKSVIDKDAALRRLGGNENLLKTMAVFFLEDAPSLMDQLVKELEAKDFDAVFHRAHSLKGLSATFDALEFKQLAEEVETLGRSRNEAMLAKKIPELRSEFIRLVSCLRELTEAAAD